MKNKAMEEIKKETKREQVESELDVVCPRERQVKNVLCLVDKWRTAQLVLQSRSTIRTGSFSFISRPPNLEQAC